METRLHSYETYLYKYVLPIMWFPWDGFRSVRRAFPPADPNNVAIGWVAIIAWFAIYSLVIWYALRLKAVFANETGLRLRGYLKELEIPFADVAGIKHNWLFKNDTLLLKQRSEFGARILFVARGRIMTDSNVIRTLDMLRNPGSS